MLQYWEQASPTGPQTCYLCYPHTPRAQEQFVQGKVESRQEIALNQQWGRPCETAHVKKEKKTMKVTQQKWDHDEGDEPNTWSALCHTADFLIRLSWGGGGSSRARNTSRTDSSWLWQGRQHSAWPQKPFVTDGKPEWVYCSAMSGRLNRPSVLHNWRKAQALTWICWIV